MPLTWTEGLHKEETAFWIHASNWNEDIIVDMMQGEARTYSSICGERWVGSGFLLLQHSLPHKNT